MISFYRRSSCLVILLGMVMSFLQITPSVSAHPHRQEEALTASLEVLVAGVEMLPMDSEGWVEVEGRTLVGAGDTIRTNEVGEAVIVWFNDGTVMNILPETELLITEFSGSADEGGDFTISTQLNLGRIFSGVRRIVSDNSSYTVEAGGVSASVRGTVFGVGRLTTDNLMVNTLWMAVNEGTVYAESGPSEQEIGIGLALEVEVPAHVLLVPSGGGDDVEPGQSDDTANETSSLVTLPTPNTINAQFNDSRLIDLAIEFDKVNQMRFDDDGDGILNRIDRCPTELGTQENFGCPADTTPPEISPSIRLEAQDSDGDGLPDGLDICPELAGVLAFGGCADQPSFDAEQLNDRDGDGIANGRDRCPRRAGLPQFFGCPDTDGDNVPDPLDKCPNRAGLPTNQGCPVVSVSTAPPLPTPTSIPTHTPIPDSDGDGVADAVDTCPNVAGLAQYQGCADTDGDGLPNPIDSCPNLVGTLANQGCPDSDGDGVPDPIDNCPNVPGPPINQGCPLDNDGDGIPNAIDNCPNVAGPVQNGGCPLPTATPKA